MNRFKKTLFAALGTVMLFGSLSEVALAASNPAGTGQPGTPTVSCGVGDAANQPNGFLTAGFAHATIVYAGSPGTPSAQNGSTKAVSQYDIACYQYTSNH